MTPYLTDKKPAPAIDYFDPIKLADERSNLPVGMSWQRHSIPPIPTGDYPYPEEKLPPYPTKGGDLVRFSKEALDSYHAGVKPLASYSYGGTTVHVMPNRV